MLSVSPRVRVLLNPGSRRQSNRRAMTAIHRLERAGWSVEVLRPSSVEETCALGADPSGFDATILSGGDGTISAFLQEAPLERTVIGIIPAWTANVVARDLRIPLDPMQAAEVMTRRRTSLLDVGEARWPDGKRRRFVLSCSTGVIAQAVADVSPHLKNITGQGAYAVSFLGAIGSSHEVTVRTDDEEFHGAIAIALLTRHYAGGLVPVPDSPRADGLIDLFLLDGRFLSYAGFTLGFLRKWSPLARFVTHRKVGSISIETSGPLEIDGDPIGRADYDSSVEIRIVGQVKVLSLAGV